MTERQEELIARIKDFDFITEKGNYDTRVPDENIILAYRGGIMNHRDIQLSVIIPTVNRPKTLRETLVSVIDQQIDIEYEIVVLDNEGLSLDIESETEAVIASISDNRIVYYRNKHSVDSAANWNTLLYLARGKWICMVHDDDVLLKNALNTLYKIVNSDKKICFVGCIQAEFSDKKPIHIKKRNNKVKEIPYEEFMYGLPVSLLGAFFEREKAVELGGFENRSYMHDATFTAKFAYYYGVYRVDSELYGYRISEKQDSANSEMNFVRRVADYYLWCSIAQKRKCLRHAYLRNCQYNLIRRIDSYNNSDLYEHNQIDANEIAEVCDFDANSLNKVEDTLYRALHFANMIFGL